MKRCGLLLLGLSLALLARPAAATTMEFEGRQRSFEMYVPPTAPRPLPVVLVLHGGRATAGQMRRYAGFDGVAAREGILAVYPQGLGGQWNDGRPELEAINPKLADTDDAAFLVALVDHLAETGLADPKRVFVAGISNGGMMAMRLACEHADRVAGIAVVAANQPAALECTPERAVPAIFIHGTRDRFIPFKGGDILQWANIDRGKVLSAGETVARWRKIDGCAGDAEATRLPPSSSHPPVIAETLRYAPCDGAPVEHVILHGGGHAWPGARQGPAGDALLGPADTGIDANEEIWAFFRTAGTPPAAAVGDAPAR